MSTRGLLGGGFASSELICLGLRKEKGAQGKEEKERIMTVSLLHLYR